MRPSPRHAGIETTCFATGQPLQRTAVTPDHVQARGALARVLADEGDPAPVRRPVGIAVAAAARHLPVADVEIAVTDGDDGMGEASRGLGVGVPGDCRKQGQRRQRDRGQEESSSARHAAVCCPTRADGMAVPPPKSAAASASVATGPTQTSSPSKSSSHAASGRSANTAASSAASSSWRLGEKLALGELGATDQLAETDEELRLERADGELPPVGRLVDPVAGEPAGEEPRQRVAAEPVRDEPVRAVRHRDGQAGAAPGAFPLEQRRQDLRDGAECAGGEVGGLQRRQAGSGVLEHARPAEVVEVVPGARGVRPLGAEARDRAVDGRGRRVVRADAETRSDSGPEALEHDVRPGEQRLGELRLRLQVTGDRLLAGVQRLVPRRCDVAHRIALGRLDSHDACSQPLQLPRCEGAREVPGQVDDEMSGEGLHRR